MVKLLVSNPANHLKEGEGIQICSFDVELPLPRGDKSKRVKKY
jgi:hypothetical protein